MNNRIYAIGDIHGCFNSMKELIENKIQLRKEDKLIFLGDYIDRGPDSKKVLDYIIELQNNSGKRKIILKKHRSLPQKEMNFEIVNQGIRKKGWL